MNQKTRSMRNVVKPTETALKPTLFRQLVLAVTTTAALGTRNPRPFMSLNPYLIDIIGLTLWEDEILTSNRMIFTTPLQKNLLTDVGRSWGSGQ